jgi:hypothetical protein
MGVTMLGNDKVKGYLKADGRKLRNENGDEVLLRGVGFGSWLLPEGYMWRFPEQGDRPRRMERMIRELIGEEEAARFWEMYYNRYISEADIQKIAEEGFNSVRVPINARFLQRQPNVQGEYHEEHLKLIDRMIEWCRSYRLYVILDLHGAPGGQTGTNIDDSANDQPELFLSEENRRETIALWRMLAERYKEEWIVAGYDLLNEPLPNWFSAYNDKVLPLYRDIIEAIREVDERHMIILEGVHWATDWSVFTEKLDDNVMLQFHKYWNNPDTESIQVYLDKRDEWNVPLFMGEGGENNMNWYAGAFQLFEDHDISWNFWTWKKMDTDNSPCSIRKPSEWFRLVQYLNGGEKPNAETALRILQQYLDNLPFEQCDYHGDVVNALLRRLPVTIPAIFYGYKGKGVSFHVHNQTRHGLGFRDNDGTDIRFIHGERITPNFQHGGGEQWEDKERLCVYLEAGEWLAYDFYLPCSTDALLVNMKLKCDANELNLSLSADARDIYTLKVTGGDWVVSRGRLPISLVPHRYTLKIKALDSRVALEWIEIRLPQS